MQSIYFIRCGKLNEWKVKSWMSWCANLFDVVQAGSLYFRLLSCTREQHGLSWSWQVESPKDGAQSDGNLSSSDLLDILLQEDSGTGSATSGSMGSRSGSGSNGCRTSGSGTGQSLTLLLYYNNNNNYIYIHRIILPDLGQIPPFLYKAGMLKYKS